MRKRVNKRAIACDIPKRVKDKVWERDEGRCIVCGSRNAAPNAHYISRAHGGLGIEENIVTLCTGFGNGCHYKFDNGTANERKVIKDMLRMYLQQHYPGWDERDLVYKKYGRLER